jgi:hypothetical protein
MAFPSGKTTHSTVVRVASDTLKHVASNITVRELWKVGVATAIAGAATAVRGAHLAIIVEIEDSRKQLQARVDLLTSQRNEAVNRAAAAESKARKPVRWSVAECALLLELRVGSMAYASIAEALGTGRTASAVGAKAEGWLLSRRRRRPRRRTARTGTGFASQGTQAIDDHGRRHRHQC